MASKRNRCETPDAETHERNTCEIPDDETHERNTCEIPDDKTHERDRDDKPDDETQKLLISVDYLSEQINTDTTVPSPDPSIPARTLQEVDFVTPTSSPLQSVNTRAVRSRTNRPRVLTFDTEPIIDGPLVTILVNNVPESGPLDENHEIMDEWYTLYD